MVRFSKINLDKDLFFRLEKQIFDMELDCDCDTFGVVKRRLINREVLTPDQFFYQAVYVVLAGGFSQKTAKRKHAEIMECFGIENGLSDVGEKNCNNCHGVVTPRNDKTRNVAGPGFDDLIKIFGNVNKVNAILKLWNGREKFCSEYYKLMDIKARLDYLSGLPHIGKITANHLARNLGENVVKYDIWIQRLGVRVFGGADDMNLVGFPLNDKIKKYADMVFEKLEKDTKYPKGYIDLILWKASQEKII